MLLGVSRGAALFQGENGVFCAAGTLLEGRTVLFGVRGTGGWGECLLGTGQTHLVGALVLLEVRLV